MDAGLITQMLRGSNAVFGAVSKRNVALGDDSHLPAQRQFLLTMLLEEPFPTLPDRSSPAISNHLRSFRNSNSVVSHQEEKEVYYPAADNAQSQLLRRMIE